MTGEAGRRITRDAIDPVARARIRQRLIDWRCAQAENVRRIADRALAERLERAIASLANGCIGVYWPVRGEPDLRPSYARWSRSGRRLALPVAVSGEPLRFVEWAPGAPTAAGPYGIPQPVAGAVVSPELLIVPCVGFSAECYRLGYGGGYYDRTLAARRVLSVGVAYDETELQLAPGPLDVALDLVVTPTRVVRAPGGTGGPSSRGPRPAADG